MRRALFLAVIASAGAACTSASPPAARSETTPRAPAAPPPAAPPPAAPPPAPLDLAHTRPAMYSVPIGWTNVLEASRDDVEARMPGVYDSAHTYAARDGYSLFAMPLDPASPDRGSQMIELASGRPGPVDEHLLADFIAHNNLGITPDVIVEQKLLHVGGRPIIKVRAEYPGRTGSVETLTYLYPVDSGAVRQLVFIVHPERYQALASQLEAIEGADPGQRAVQDQVLELYQQQRRAQPDAK